MNKSSKLMISLNADDITILVQQCVIVVVM